MPDNIPQPANKANKKSFFEWGIILFTIFFLIGYFYIFINITLDPNDPYKTYYTNPGILTIYTISSISCVGLITMFFTNKQETNETQMVLYLLCAFVIGFLSWFELFYGSTFYYGEVRDKQGLHFPFFPSAMFMLVIWKPTYASKQGKDFMIKIALSGLLGIGLQLLWQYGYNNWNLF